MEHLIKISANLEERDQFVINKLKYPRHKYNNLRTMELIREEQLYDGLYPELVAKISRGKRKLTKD
jgi:hypothetical protein